tara:strand:- start:110 stop:760 length:651 start_codon:yes stop_codon:yes gene_type:complete
MPDYSLGKIYMVYPKVDDVDEGDVYYGSTTVTLARRMARHRSSNNCSSKILFDKYGVENCFIELVEEYPCDTKEQLNKKEGEYIRNHKCINKYIAGRTPKEWLDDNINKMKEYHKEYYTENIDKLKEYKKQYRTENVDKLKETQKKYRTENVDKLKETRKKYCTENRDNILEYHKQYYDKTKDKISELNKQKASCPICNKELSKGSIPYHIKTQHK